MHLDYTFACLEKVVLSQRLWWLQCHTRDGKKIATHLMLDFVEVFFASHFGQEGKTSCFTDTPERQMQHMSKESLCLSHCPDEGQTRPKLDSSFHIFNCTFCIWANSFFYSMT
jgi:hypothetical protein